MSKNYSMLINGKQVTTDASFPVTNPATEEVIGHAPEVDAASIELALSSADAAFKVWSRMPLAERSKLIHKYANLLEENRDEIIDLLIAETGKPFDNATMISACLRLACATFARKRPALTSR